MCWTSWPTETGCLFGRQIFVWATDICLGDIYLFGRQIFVWATDDRSIFHAVFLENTTVGFDENATEVR